MVFTSIPACFDPSNWQQQQQQQQNHPSLHHGISSSINMNMISNPLFPPPPLPPRPPPPPPPQPHMSVPSSIIRPGSMAERARMANIPMPEAGLKCPRCDSTNTKFCYFNNYNLSQPRHFCKACRRYWTRGGALRNVPVGGGCRRNNKRSKSKPSSSSTSASESAAATSSATVSTDMMTGLTPPSSSLQYQLTGFGGAEQWRIPPPPPPTQLPFLGALEGGGSSLYRHPFEGGVEFSSLRSRLGELVKMERYTGGEQYEWGGESSSSGNAWTDLPAINNSSCSTTSAL